MTNRENTQYIALLRGINVGGHVVKMERLRAEFAALGLAEVRSYIQSGNVFFETAEDSDRAQLTARIEARLRTALGFEVPTFLRTLPELEDVLESAPFRDKTPAADERFLVVFTDNRILPNLALPCASAKNDGEIVGCTAGETFLRLTVTGGRMADPAVLMRQVFGAASGRALGTARFYHTLQKIAAAART